jgi:hypothetical protein
MSSTLEECRQQAKHLSLRERAILIKTLIEDLDDLDERNLEQLWIKECSRRFQEFKAGNIEARPGADVFGDVRNKLQTIR